MSEIKIREATPEDADLLIAYTKRIGGESDNLTFGAEGLPLTTEQEKAFLQSIHDDNHSVFYCAWKKYAYEKAHRIRPTKWYRNHKS